MPVPEGGGGGNGLAIGRDLDDGRQAVVAGDVEGEDRGAEDQEEVMGGEAGGDGVRGGGEETCEKRMVLREAGAAGEGAREDGGAEALGQGHGRGAGACGIHLGADDEDGVAAGGSAVAASWSSSGSGPVSRPMRRGARGSAGAGQSSIGMETKVGPQGGCMATCQAWARAAGTSSALAGSVDHFT